jgi:hypothetical protein
LFSRVAAGDHRRIGSDSSVDSAARSLGGRSAAEGRKGQCERTYSNSKGSFGRTAIRSKGRFGHRTAGLQRMCLPASLPIARASAAEAAGSPVSSRNNRPPQCFAACCGHTVRAFGMTQTRKSFRIVPLARSAEVWRACLRPFAPRADMFLV